MEETKVSPNALVTAYIHVCRAVHHAPNIFDGVFWSKGAS